MNPKIYSTRLSGYATITASEAEDASYPLANLLDYNPNRYWQSNTTAGSQYLQIDFGQDVAKNFILMHNHNLSTIDGYKVESCASAGFSSGVNTIIATNTPSDDLLLVQNFTADAERYMRITFTGSNPLAAKPKIGNLFIGPSFQFQNPFEVGAVEGDRQFATSSSVSLSGIKRTAQPFAGRRVFEYQWRNIDNSEAADLKLLSGYIFGDLIPFYLYYDAAFLPRLVRFAKPPTVPRGRVWNINDTDKLTFEEYIASDDITADDQWGGQTLIYGVPLVGA